MLDLKTDHPDLEITIHPDTVAAAAAAPPANDDVESGGGEHVGADTTRPEDNGATEQTSGVDLSESQRQVVRLETEDETDWMRDEERGDGELAGSDVDSDSSASSSDDEADDLHEELPTAEVPFPGFEKTVFRCLPQTHKLRLICLHLITSPYPLLTYIIFCEFPKQNCYCGKFSPWLTKAKWPCFLTHLDLAQATIS